MCSVKWSSALWDFVFKISHAHISFWILSQLVSSFWGRLFWGFGFFCQRSWWTEWQDYLRFIVSDSWWLHVWSLLSVYIVLYTPKGYYGISSIIGTSVHPQFWHVDIFVRLLPLESSWMLPVPLLFDTCLCSEILLLPTLCPSLISGSCRIFSAFFAHYFSKNYFFIFLSCIPFKTTRILLRSASIWLSKVCLLENVQSWWIFFKTANVFLLKYKIVVCISCAGSLFGYKVNMEYPPVNKIFLSVMSGYTELYQLACSNLSSVFLYT